jgi:hypothetical protein
MLSGSRAERGAAEDAVTWTRSWRVEAHIPPQNAFRGVPGYNAAKALAIPDAEL